MVLATRNTPAMQYALRDYQEKGLELATTLFPEPYAVQLQVPTGGGKTMMFSQLAVNVWGNSNGRRKTLVLTHNKTLLHQTKKNLWKNGRITATTNKNTFLRNPWKFDALVCNIQVLVHFLKKDEARARALWAELARHFDFIAVDESHHYVSDTFIEPLKYFRDEARINMIGFSATPKRGDGRSLQHIFSSGLVQAKDFRADVPRLMAGKNLSPYELLEKDFEKSFGVSLQEALTNAEHLPKKVSDEEAADNDYSAEQLKSFAAFINCDKVVQDWLEFANGRKTIVFCPSVALSEELAEKFNAQGIAAEHMDGKTSKSDREEKVARFSSGNVKVLSNCQLVSEGFDVPDAEVLIILSPTKSIITHLQRIGRVLRYVEGKIALIMDYVGAFAKLGTPESAKNNDWRKAYEFGSSDMQCEVCKTYFLPTWKEQDFLVQIPLMKEDGTPIFDENGEQLTADGYCYTCPKCGHKHFVFKGADGGGDAPDNTPETTTNDRFSFKRRKPTMRPSVLREVFTFTDEISDIDESQRQEYFLSQLDTWDFISSLTIDECREVLDKASVIDSDDCWGSLFARRAMHCADYQEMLDFLDGTHDEELREIIWEKMPKDARRGMQELRRKYAESIAKKAIDASGATEVEQMIAEMQSLVSSQSLQKTLDIVQESYCTHAARKLRNLQSPFDVQRELTKLMLKAPGLPDYSAEEKIYDCLADLAVEENKQVVTLQQKAEVWEWYEKVAFAHLEEKSVKSFKKHVAKMLGKNELDRIRALA